MVNEINGLFIYFLTQIYYAQIMLFTNIIMSDVKKSSYIHVNMYKSNSNFKLYITYSFLSVVINCINVPRIGRKDIDS